MTKISGRPGRLRSAEIGTRPSPVDLHVLSLSGKCFAERRGGDASRPQRDACRYPFITDLDPIRLDGRYQTVGVDLYTHSSVVFRLLGREFGGRRSTRAATFEKHDTRLRRVYRFEIKGESVAGDVSDRTRDVRCRLDRRR